MKRLSDNDVLSSKFYPSYTAPFVQRMWTFLFASWIQIDWVRNSTTQTQIALVIDTKFFMKFVVALQLMGVNSGLTDVLTDICVQPKWISTMTGVFYACKNANLLECDE